MAEINLAGLTFTWNDYGWLAYRRFDSLPAQEPLPAQPEEPALPDSYDVLLTIAGANSNALIQAIRETAGSDRSDVEAAIADPRGSWLATCPSARQIGSSCKSCRRAAGRNFICMK